jgi:hypothetical protein
MKTTEITTKEIFEKGQILTVAKAKEMVGKTIAITNAEYKYNRPDVRVFTIYEFCFEWDLAAKRDYPDSKFDNFQQYWASYMTPKQVDDMKSRLSIIDTEGNSMAIAEMNIAQSFFPEPTFFGSDADREVYYIEIPA